MRASALLLVFLLAAAAPAAADDVPAPADSPSSDGADPDADPDADGADPDGEDPDGLGGPGGDDAPLDPIPPGRNDFAGAALQRDMSAPPTQSTLGRGVRPRRWLTLRPVLRLSAFYTDNVRRSDGNEEDDVELTATLTLDLTARRRSYTASVTYTLVQRTFVDADDLDAFDQVLSGRIGFELKQTSIDISATIGRLTRPDDPALQGGEARRWSSQAGLNINHSFSRTLGLLVEGSFSYLDFEDNRAGSDTLGYGGNLFLTRPVPLLRGTAQLGGGYRELRYPGAERVDADLGLINLSVGYSLEWRRLSGQIRIGYETSVILERRQFPRNSDPPDGLVASGNLAWRVRRSTRVQLLGSRQINLGSASNGAQTTTRVGLVVSERLTSTLELALNGDIELQEPERGGDLLSFTVGGLLEWTPKPWLVVGAQGSYQTADRDRAEEYDVFRLGISISFRL